MGRTCSGWGSGAQQTCWGPTGLGSCGKSSDTLLGFETTSPSPLRPDGGEPGVIASRRWLGVACCCSALVVGGGVWFVDSGCEHLGSECGHAARMGGVGFLVSDVQFQSCM